MKNSLFTRYFTICSSIVLLSITFLGVMLMVFAGQYFRTDRYHLLERNATQAVALTVNNLKSNNFEKVEVGLLQSAYIILGSTIDADIFLSDVEGKTILCSDTGDCDHYNVSVPLSAIRRTVETGKMQQMGHLGGLYQNQHFIIGLPVEDGSGNVAGVVFATASADALNNLMVALLKMFIISAGAAVVLSFVICYFATGSLTRPLREMARATKAFSGGDFTIRVPVEGYDEMGQLAMAFNSMANSLTAQESMRRSFVANVSHELKTPMTTIGGFIDGILDGTVPPEKERQYLKTVSVEMQRLSRLVRSMLNIARIEAGEMTLTTSHFDLNDVVCRTVFTFEQMIEEKKLEIKGLDTGKVMVEADEDLIYQVIYNLSENAVKFANEGGTVEFSYTTDPTTTYLAITNSGTGISKEELPRLFDRFYKSDKSRSLDKNGVGLGLHIVKTIVNLHGGEVFVHSVEGEYSEFVFSIPTYHAKGGLFRKSKEKTKAAVTTASEEELPEEPLEPEDKN